MNITFKEPLCSAKTRQRFSRILIFAMRTGFFYTVLVVSTACTLLATHHGNGQAIDSTYVTLDTENETLKTLLKKIENQTNLRFSFLSAVKDYPVKDLPRNEMSVKEVLDIAIQGQLAYHLINNSYVVIKEVVPSEPKKDTKEDNIKAITSPRGKQPFTVTGTVREASTGAPLPGVNIIVKGTTRGTTTDSEGRFAIEAEDNEVLVFTFIGYKIYETEVRGRTVIEVAMEVDMQTLQEVEVNAGYWRVKDREQTGNIARITSDEIQKQPVSNPLAALQGRMAGVYIQQNTGVPGGSFNIRIRGQNSLRANGNDPLYIIDGVPFTSEPIVTTSASLILPSSVHPLSNINTADIESIEVLKDADATAIYGSRGANGVVLITTKKGGSEGLQLDLNIHQGVGKVTRMLDLLNTEQWLEMRNEAYRNDNVTPGPREHDMNGNWDTTRYTDWQKALIGGTANITNVQTSISGGNINTRFLIGGGYYSESTVFPYGGVNQKASAHLNLNHTSPNKQFRTDVTITYMSNANNFNYTDLTSLAITLPPVAPAIYNDDGTLNWEKSTWTNPLAETRKKYNGVTDNLVSNVTLSYQVVSGLSLKSSFGYTNLITREIGTLPISSADPANASTGSSTFSNGNIKTWLIEPQVEYQRNIWMGRLTALIGATFQKSRQEGEGIFGYGYTSDALLENIKAAPNVLVVSANSAQYRYNAIFGRLNYNLKEKYLINFTIRRDGSSRFGPDRKFANFGAVGTGWIISNEPFVKNNLRFLSFAKLRASYGVTGSDRIGDYGYLDTFSATTYPYQGKVGLIPTRLANAEFSWETNRKSEGSVELGFLSDKLLLTASYFHNRSSNQLVGYSLPPSVGFTSVQFNLPATVQNTGWEFEVNTQNVKNQHFSWSSAINITIPRSKLIEYPNIESSPYRNSYKVGSPLSIKKLYHYTGVDPITGSYTFQDIDNDGNITNPNDLQFIKQVDQKYFGGMQNTISYKGFQLEIFFQFVKQTGFNYLKDFYNAPGTFFNNQPTVVMNRWQGEGDKTNIQRFTTTDGPVRDAYSNARINGDLAISDASFIRLKTLALSWQLPFDLRQKMHLEKCKIYMQGQNLLTITNYLGMDPENQNSRVLPPLRILTFGVQITL